MLAEYHGNFYNYIQVDEKKYLMTYDSKKVDESFYAHRNYFLKDVTMSEDDIGEVYTLHFWVTYKDTIENEKEWIVDEGQPLFRVPDITKGEVGLTVMHDAHDDSWIQNDKNAASKIILLEECERLYIEKHTVYCRGCNVDEKTIQEVSCDEFINTMVSCRREKN